MTKIYLKSNTVVEPLCWNWYAWSHLIYPATAAMHVAYRHVPIMERFLANASERLTVSNQKFESGPIVQLEESKTTEIKALLHKTREENISVLSLAECIKAASQGVEARHGKTLEPVYAELGEPLQGLTELVYDLNFSAGLRFVEPLIYQDFYTTKHQSVAFSTVDSDQRPFILGTPRLENIENCHVSVAFNAEILDSIFRSQFAGIDQAELLSELKLPAEKAERLLSFFTDEPPQLRLDRSYTGEGVRVRYYGHACVLLQTRDINILIDPLISYSYASEIERFTFEDLPERIDYLLITHAHQDHFSIENLIKLRHKVVNVIVPRSGKGNLADPSLKRVLHKLGFSLVIEMDELDVNPVAGGRIVAIPFLGEHAELDIQAKSAYMIELSGQSFLFAADSNNYDNAVYQRVFKQLPKIDVLFIGMECDGGPLNWLYGPLITRDHDKEATRTRTLSGSDFPKAQALAKESGCQAAYVYSMGQEPWLNYIMNINYTEESLQLIESDKFVKTCSEMGLQSKRLFGRAEWHYA